MCLLSGAQGKAEMLQAPEIVTVVPRLKSSTQSSQGCSPVLELEVKANLWPSGDQAGCVSLCASPDGSHDPVGSKLKPVPSEWTSQMSKSCPPALMFEEKAIAFWGTTSVSTSGHLIVGTGGDAVEVSGRGEAVGTTTGVEVGKEGVGMEVLARGEAVGRAAGVRVGEEIVGWAEGDAVPPMAVGSALGTGLTAQATRNAPATTSKANPSNGLLDPSMVEAFHMGMFPPVFQREVP
jgi:hypothetical protein